MASIQAIYFILQLQLVNMKPFRMYNCNKTIKKCVAVGTNDHGDAMEELVHTSGYISRKLAFIVRFNAQFVN